MIVKYENLNYKTDKIIKYTNYIVDLFEKNKLFKTSQNINIKDKQLIEKYSFDFRELKRVLKDLQILTLTKEQTYFQTQKYAINFKKAICFNILCKAIEQVYNQNKNYIYNHSIKIELDLLHYYSNEILKDKSTNLINFSDKNIYVIYNNILNSFYNLYFKTNIIFTKKINSVSKNFNY